MGMPAQDLHFKPWRNERRLISDAVLYARFILIAVTVGVTTYGVYQMLQVVRFASMTLLQGLMIFFFAISLAWIAFAAGSVIAGASKRLESLHFGVADYAASTKARTTNIGGANPDYAVLTDPDAEGHRLTHWGDMWHYAIARMVVAARANGIRPIDGPFGDFSDAEGYRAAARRAAVLGCEGKWAIHPSQVALGNEMFTPSEAEVTKAKRILAAMEEAQRDGRGAVALDGKLIDLASIRQAEVLVKKAAQIASAG